MTIKALNLLATGLFAIASQVYTPAAIAAEFQLTKIVKNLITSPVYSYSGAQQYPTNPRDRWLELEAEFIANPDFTDELTFRYFVLYNGRLLSGEVTHTSIAAGRENHSVMYVPPRILARFSNNGIVVPNSVQNVAVQIVQQGLVKDDLSLARGPAQWYKASPAITGLLLNKNETPFAPLYWDRYPPIKTR